MATDISIRNNLDVQIGILFGYFNDSIEVYLEGKVSVLTLSVLDENNYRELLEKGNSLSFTHEDEDYHMTIVKKEEDEDTVTITAWSLVMELNNETKKPFEGTSLTFEQYLKAFDGERILTLGINEVADKKISYKWESQTNMLERLYSLAKVFNAEIEFIPVLDDDGSLKQLIVNVYKEHDTSNQGIGQDNSSQVFYFGDNISTVRKTSDIMSLYTAIRPTGKDGLTLNSYNMSEVKDEDGKVLYYLKNGMLYAPQAREQFRSNLINKSDGWTVYDWATEYTTQVTLCGNALTKLKELSSPVTTWTIEGYIDAKIGDTISIQDDGYSPTLLLTARIIAQKICMTDPSSNETTFSNVIEQKSEISADLIAKMNELIAEKIVYTSSLITTNGISFKNGEGTTTLKAKVFSGSAEITEDVTVRWYKNDVFVKTAYELEVKALDVEEKAVYRFEVIDTFGIMRTTSEVTIFNVSDGSNGLTPYFHTAWANSADGKTDFSTTVSLGKKYLGNYTDYTQTDSTDPTKYRWTETSNAIDLHFAYSWSHDGTDRFTKDYPNPNLIKESVNRKLSPYQGAVLNQVIDYDMSITWNTKKATQVSGNVGTNRTFGVMVADTPNFVPSNGTKVFHSIKIKNLATGTDLEISNNMAKSIVIKPQETKSVVIEGIGNGVQLTQFVFSLPQIAYDSGLRGFNFAFFEPKIEYNSATIYTTNEEEDFDNAYPKYRGSSTRESTKPEDYNWSVDPAWIELSTERNLNDKVNNDEFNEGTTQIWEEINNRVTQEEAEGIKELAQSITDSYNAFVSNGGQYQADLESLESRTSALVQQLGDQLATYEFLKTYIKLGEEGIVIGAENSSMKVQLSKDRLSFTDGGQTIAYFSNQSFFINRGAIVDSLQVGQHKMIRLNEEHTIFQYIQ